MKKNILILIGTLKQWWGAEKVAAMLWNTLQSQGYCVHFLSFYTATETFPISSKHHCCNEVVSKNLLVNCMKLFQRWRKISRYCKRHNIDVNISFMEDINFCNLFSKIFFKNTAKIIVSVHNNVNKISYISRLFIKMFYNFSDSIVTVVQEEKENLIYNYGIDRRKIEVIYNPLTLKEISVLQKQKISEVYSSYFQDNSVFTFINIGRLIHVKNHKSLIEVFQEFHAIYPKSQFLILWEWELRADLENMIKQEDAIHLLGLQENPYNFLAKSDCFLFGSLNEGFWIVLTEALACWVPIISMDCPTWPKEILKKDIHDFTAVDTISKEEFWILVPPNDKDLFLEAMIELYNNKNIRATYVEKSKERAIHFDIEILIKKWEALF